MGGRDAGTSNRAVVLKAGRIEAARRWFWQYVQYTVPSYGWADSHQYVAQKLQDFVEAVDRGESPRLMVMVMPRWGKSLMTSRLLPGWILGRRPDWNVGIVSYGAELAEELSADARRFVMDDPYREIFGDAYQSEPGSTVELDRTSKAVNHWRVAGHRGGVRAVGVGGALTGRGFNVCIIDDPVKGRKEADSDLYREDLWRWYQGTLRTRMEPGGGLLVIQTRWHHDDLAGRLLRGSTSRWDVVRLPALAEEDDPLGRLPGEPLDPARFSIAELLRLRDDPVDGVSSRDWIAQYQQKPTPDEGSIFKREWFRIEELDLHIRGNTVQCWDTAFSERREADYSVCTTWRIYTYPSGQVEYQLLNVYRARLSFPALREKVYEAAEIWHPHRIIIEDIGSGQSLVQELRNSSGLPIVTYRPDRDKVARAHAITGLVEAGRVVLNKDAGWLEPYLSEMMSFPVGEHDDQVDSTTMFLASAGIYRRLTSGRPRLSEFRFEV